MNQTYERITGRSYGTGGISTLWLGEGHVLQVTSWMAVEHYRRWYLSEMQAIVMRRSAKRMIYNLIWGVIAGFALAGTAGLSGLAASSDERETRIVLIVFGAIVGAIALVAMTFLLINTFLGATCVVYVQTPNGLESLNVPTRKRRAEALIERLRPVLHAEQQRQAPSTAS